MTKFSRTQDSNLTVFWRTQNTRYSLKEYQFLLPDLP